MQLLARGRSVEPHASWPRQALTWRAAASGVGTGIQGRAHARSHIDPLGGVRAGEADERRPEADANREAAARGVGKFLLGGCPQGQ